MTELEPGREYFVKVGGNTLYAATDSDVFSGIIQLDIQSPAPAPEMAALSGSAASAIESPVSRQREPATVSNTNQEQKHNERLHDQPMMPAAQAISLPAVVERNGYVSVQVNVDELGNNIVGDAANEPSMAINPVDPAQIVIGWRQFDSVESDFRQAGYAYSHDGGETWTFPGVLDPGAFRSDPVLDSGPDGEFYYNSLEANQFEGTLFVSHDGGVNWNPMPGIGEDKPWFVVDKTNGPGRGNVYGLRRFGHGLTRWIPSIDKWDTAESDADIGTLAVGLDGSVYVLGYGSAEVTRNAKYSNQPLTIPLSVPLSLFGSFASLGQRPNGIGLVGQPWIATEPQRGTHPHHIYALNSGADVRFARSTDAGLTWSAPLTINDDPAGWQWFGTLCVAPTGRIDVFWNDARNADVPNLSELYYSYSIDQGRTWSINIPVGPVWDSFIGWPQQDKIGDYYHCVSDAHAANLAYAATFNGEQDIYFLRLEPDIDCNRNGVVDRLEVKEPGVLDCDGDWVPDDCEGDADDDGLIDGCDDDMDGDGVSNEADVCFVNGAGATVGPDGRPLADTNQDCLVDRMDYQRWLRCTQADAPSACFPAFDVDQDGALSLADFAAFQRSFWINRE